MKRVFITITILLMISASECYGQWPFKKRKQIPSFDHTSYRALFSNVGPAFSDAMEEYDNEIYEFILDYSAPSFIQLQLVKDSLGQNAQELLLDQIDLHEIFKRILGIHAKLKEIEFITGIVPHSTDYTTNTEIIKRIGKRWIEIDTLNSLLIKEKFEEPSALTAILKTKYEDFYSKLIVFQSLEEIRKMKVYTFEGTAEKQQKYWDSLFSEHKKHLPNLNKSCKQFLKFNHSNFKDLSTYINTKYPTINDLLKNS